MQLPGSPHTVRSLDDAIGPGAESLVVTARRQRLLCGVAVGVVRDDESFLCFYGEHVGPDSMFELGSVTKTYTAELLAKLVERGTVRLDDPLALYLPEGLEHHEGPHSVTLLDLVTHYSGEPRLPPGLNGFSRNPYAGYSDRDLEQYLRRRPLQRPAAAQCLYSNLGYSILGYALARAAGVSYAELLQREILGPLEMQQTALALGQKQPRLLRGHTQTGIPTGHWTFQACAPCGALCSTAGDQLKYVRWLLENPDRTSLRARASAPGGSVGLGWVIREGGSCWHNGGTFGFSSYLSLDPVRRTGIVVLSDRYAPMLLTTLGIKFERLMAGETVEPLHGDYGKARAWILDPILLTLSALSPFARALTAMRPR